MQLAIDEITGPNTPQSIKYKYDFLVKELTQKTKDIEPIYAKHMKIQSSDPVCIKELKKQANVILNKDSHSCMAWRIDIALLFERYVQHIVNMAAKERAAKMIANHRNRADIH